MTTTPFGFSRRQFVLGLAAGGAMSVAAPHTLATGASQPGLVQDSAAVLTGTEFDLVVAPALANYTGVSRPAVAINGSIPAPTLVWREGDTVTIRVTNRLPVDTSIHWHGIILPFTMDGVPNISFAGIAPGQTFTYRFKVEQTGTYWYHSHSGFQEMSGMYGSIVVVPAAGERIRADRDYVVQLSDWTDEEPMAVFAKLKHQGDYYNFNQPTAPDFMRDVANYGFSQAVAKRRMWNQMRMSPTDLADISAETFTYLLNGRTPAGNWTGLFDRGERVRLRFINGSSNTFYDVRIPNLPLTVVQADGQDVEPVTVDEFRFGPGETYDVVVQPRDDAYTLFAQSMDRTGYARGTLALHEGLSAPVPAMDAPQPLSMTDMMGAMDHGGGGMDHSQHGGMAMDHSKHSGMTMDHSQHGAKAMDHSQHGGMAMDHSKHGGMAMDHSKHGGKAMDHSQHRAQAAGIKVPSTTVNHARTEYGPSVDMRVDTPRTNLDDPGIGLRNNGRRVLTLADLRTIGGPMDQRLPEREVELHLTGNMERYSWSFDGLEFGDSTPVHFRHGERLRVILQNDTMMTHPMHLHGMWSELENERGEFLARLHTIPVQPAQRISFQVTADALGRWAWHCHLLFHMDAGMFRQVVVS
ncbi:copper resistance system multicopper oxidase [Pseudomaricurvus alcaniphilus]|uniref:copper resistance system multicopper oxidase n=1 Tax=Pseudomaricurvus alcaniphilus TaxID=1166482 RepID=UPI00140E79A5|nr:copper resistance system multicopper oxidase [Pseudomaricurvus alcaniphilus]NHN37837.1 copper resistance system multicopper oxidase [Pseudomaricurvus alcaniphilus]